jgi:hypothetical protein
MKIIIKDEDDTLELSNDSLDNDNYIEIAVTVGTGDTKQMMVSLDDLFSALIAFDSLRSRHLSRQERLSSEQKKEVEKVKAEIRKSYLEMRLALFRKLSKEEENNNCVE